MGQKFIAVADFCVQMLSSRLISTYQFDFTEHNVGKRCTQSEQRQASASRPLPLSETLHTPPPSWLHYFFLIKNVQGVFLGLSSNIMLAEIHSLTTLSSAYVPTFTPHLPCHLVPPCVIFIALTQPGNHLINHRPLPIAVQAYEQVLLLLSALSPVPNM